MKNEKKVEKTKATLVRELEAKLKVNKGFLASLERANKETIVKLLSTLNILCQFILQKNLKY